MTDYLNKGENMYYIEKIFYETRPFFYGLIGVYALAHYSNRILLVCGLTLLYCCTFVMNKRFAYRLKMSKSPVVLPSKPKEHKPHIHKIDTTSFL